MNTNLSNTIFVIVGILQIVVFPFFLLFFFFIILKKIKRGGYSAGSIQGMKPPGTGGETTPFMGSEMKIKSTGKRPLSLVRVVINLLIVAAMIIFIFPSFFGKPINQNLGAIGVLILATIPFFIFGYIIYYSRIKTEGWIKMKEYSDKFFSERDANLLKTNGIKFRIVNARNIDRSVQSPKWLLFVNPKDEARARQTLGIPAG